MCTSGIRSIWLLSSIHWFVTSSDWMSKLSLLTTNADHFIYELEEGTPSLTSVTFPRGGIERKQIFSLSPCSFYIQN